MGDALDWWRVEEREEGRLLRLRAEMRLPGLAWPEFHVEHDPAGARPGPLPPHGQPGSPKRVLARGPG